ncbi:MAG: choice-of-anchor C family protein [Thermoleophilia bacterium]|nr:choice-of-anchor C family protein [Thermoleophilia bacterium]
MAAAPKSAPGGPETSRRPGTLGLLLPLLALLVALIVAQPAAGAIAQVQASPTGSGSGASVTATFGTATAARNLLVATVMDVNGSCSTTTFTAPVGWVRAASVCRGANGPIEIWYRSNAPAGITGVTFGTGHTGANSRLQVTEWSGAAMAGALDRTGTSSSATSGTAPSVSTSGNVSESGELAITTFQTSGGLTSLTPGTGWTNIGSSAATGFIADHRIDPASGAALSETVTASPGTTWGAAIATFRAAETTAPNAADAVGGPADWQNTASQTIWASRGDDYGSTGASTSQTARYEFDAGSGSTVADRSGNGYTLSLAGYTWTTDRFGNPASAMAFGSGGYGDIQGDLSTGGTMSVAMWAKFDTLNGNWSRLFDFGGTDATGSLNNFTLSKEGAGSDDLRLVVEDWDSSPTYVDAISATDVIQAGRWQHYAATIDATGLMKLYVDGALVASGGSHPLQTGVRDNHYFGRSNFVADDGLQGAIDGVVVTDTTLSAADVAAVAGASGVKRYEYRTSTDGGVTWGLATTGSSRTVTAQGETQVQYRVVDNHDLAGAWGPTSPTSASTARIDRTSPGTPGAAGGSTTWSNANSATVTAQPGTDTGPTGLRGSYFNNLTLSGSPVLTRTEGVDVNWGAWTAPDPLVNATGFSVRWEGTVTAPTTGTYTFQTQSDDGVRLWIDGQQVIDDWTNRTITTDTAAPVTLTAGRAYPVVMEYFENGGVAEAHLLWHTPTSGGFVAVPRAQLSPLTHEYRLSTDGGTTWSPTPVSGPQATVLEQGQTLVQFRATDAAGNVSGWGPAAGTAGATVRLDRTGPGGNPSGNLVSNGTFESPAIGSGFQNGTTGQAYGAWSITAGNVDLVASTGVGVWNAADGSQSLDMNGTGPGTISQTLATTPGTVYRITFALAGNPGVAGVRELAVGWGGSTLRTVRFDTTGRTGTSMGWTTVTLEATATSGSTALTFQSLTASGTYGPAIDSVSVVPQSGPTVSGGSLSWQPVASVAVTGASATDALSGMSGYEYRTSTDGGANWGSATPGTTAAITAEGETLVQFRGVDAAGNAGPWAPSIPTAGNTVRIDRTIPTDPTVSGGSLSWQGVPGVTFGATGSDGGPSGLGSYGYRTSTDNGGTWSAPIVGGLWGADVWVSAVGPSADVPQVGVDSAGNAVAVWRQSNGVNFVIYAADRPAGGAWSAPTALTSGGPDPQAPVLAVAADGTAVAAWVRSDGGAIRIQTAVRSASGTWGATTYASVGPGANNPVVAIDASGNAVAAWEQNGILSARYSGGSWSTPVPVGASGAQQAAIAMNAGGETVVAWKRTDGAKTRIETVNRSGAGAWSAVTILSAAGQDAQQPDVAVSPAGAMTAAWSRSDGTNLVIQTAERPAGGAWGPATTRSAAGGDAVVPRLAAHADGAVVAAWSRNDGTANRVQVIERSADGAWGPVATMSDPGQPAWAAKVATSANGDAILSWYRWDGSRYRVQSRVKPSGGTWGATTTHSDGGATAYQVQPAMAPDGTAILVWQYFGSPGRIQSAVRTADVRATVTGEGTTLVQFRATDGAGNVGNWAPASAVAGSTAKIDRTAPTGLTLTGGSLLWRSVYSASITASAASDPLSGVSGYEYRTSTDGGTTWSTATSGATATASANGETLVQFRATDTAGNAGAWSPSSAGATNTIRIQRGTIVLRGRTSTVNGGGASIAIAVPPGTEADDLLLAQVAADGGAGTTITPPAGWTLIGRTDTGSTAHATYRRTATGSEPGSHTWTFGAGVGASGGMVGYSGVEPSSPTTASTSTSGTGTPFSVTAPTVTVADSMLVILLAQDADGALTAPPTMSQLYQSAYPGPRPGVIALDEPRPTTGLPGVKATAAAPGVAFNARSLILRPRDTTPPTDPIVSGGSLGWQNGTSVTVSPSGSTDDNTGVAGYEHRTSIDNGSTWTAPTAGSSVAVTAEGTTLVQFRAVDAAGNAGAWTPSTPGAGNTVKLDRTLPATPTLTGGSLSWQSATSVAITATGGSDALSGVSGHEYRTSTDDGVTWGTPTAGATAVVTAEGQTLVQFRTVDGAGNTSAWTPPASDATNTVRLDRTAPSAPTVSGGSLSWQSAASVTVTASGGTDAGGSGLAGYQHRTSTDAGATWSSTAIAGNAVSVTEQGQTLVQYRSVDGAGNVGAWAPAGPTAGGTVRLDRTAPGGNGGEELVSNGGFETPAIGGAFVNQTSSFGGWTLASGNVDLDRAWNAPASGSQSLDLNGTIPGSISQIVKTTPGATYRISFALAGNPGLPVVKEALVHWDGAPLRTVRFDTTGKSTSAPGWTTVTLEATATNPTAVLRFEARSTGNVGVLLDDISVTEQTGPAVSGGSLAWRSAASTTVTAAGATDAHSGVSGHQHRTSTDGGATWGPETAGSSAAITAEGETLVQFRAVDDAGNEGAWRPAAATAGSTVRLDRTAPTAPTVSGGSLAWQRVASVTITPSGATDAGGSALAGHEYRTSTDGGAGWTGATAGASHAVTAEGETLVQYRSVDGAGNTSDWAPAVATAGATARIDRTAPTAPTVNGGSATWQSVASVTVTASGGTDAGGSALAGHQHRWSTDTGTTWTAPVGGSSIAVNGEGETLVQFRSIDDAGNTGAWTPASPAAGSKVRIDRTAPTDPTVSGGSLSWRSVPSVTVTGGGSTDALTAVAGHEHRESTDGGTTWTPAAAGTSVDVTAEGETLVQFRVTDTPGNTGPWTPASPTAGSTVRINRSGPTAPTASGGSQAWQNATSVTVTGSGATVAAGTIAGYEHRTSADGGTTWSAPAAGASVIVTAEGETLVQFRAVDDAANAGPWGPSSPTAGSMVRIDRTNPGAPTASGGSASWQSVASVTLSAVGATDTPGGIASHEYRESTDGGATWSTAATGAMRIVSTEGETLIQFRAVDAAGNTGPWSATGLARIDRTAPADATVTGGSPSWQSVASVTVGGTTTDAGGSGLSGLERRSSTDGGATWSAGTPGTPATVTEQGETLIQFRGVDGAGNAGAWAPAPPGAGGTVRIDRTGPGGNPGPELVANGDAEFPAIGAGPMDTVAPAVFGPWNLTAGSGIGIGTAWQAGSGVQAIALNGSAGPATLSQAIPTSAGAVYRIRFLLAGDPTGGPAVKALGVSWAGTVLRTLRFDTTGRGTADMGWTVVTLEATAGSASTALEFQSLTPGSHGPAIDDVSVTEQSGPTVSGGSLAWRNQASTTVTGSGATDALSGVAFHEHRTSTDGGTTWGAPAAGGAVTVTAEGETLVQYRGVDAAGNAGPWAPATGTAGSTVRLDRTAPTAPSVGGGSNGWQSVASVTVTGSGSTDAVSGVASHEHRTSTDGGTTWGTPASGGAVTVTGEGETLVQFRTADQAGNTSAWAPATATAGSTVRINRTGPSAPTVSGGAVGWQSVASVTVAGSGATVVGGAITGYEHRASVDGGTTWGTAAAGATLDVTDEGQTLVQFRATDDAGNTGPWGPSSPTAGSTVRIDRTDPTAPAVTGGSASWQNAASITVSGSGGSGGVSGLTGYEHRTSTDGGATWDTPAWGPSFTATAEGETLVQFRSVDNAGTAGAWTPASATAGSTARIDRTDPTDPTVSGGSLAWRSEASVTVTATGGTDAVSSVTGFQHRESTDGGTTWDTAAAGDTVDVTAEGETLVQFRSVDAAGNTGAWTPATATPGSTVRIDRGLPTVPTVSGGSLAWQNIASIALTGGGSTDDLGAVTYEHRTSTDGGTTWSTPASGDTVGVTAEGETLVRFRALDDGGNASAWSAAATARIDRTVPTAPSVDGGSLTWRNIASVAVTGSGSTDAVSAVAAYEHRTSTDGGTTWSAGATGGAVTVTDEGETLVQVRSVDAAGNTGAWTPAAATAGSTVRIDRTDPTAPTAGGGSLAWQSVASVTVSASGATDGVSSVASHQHRTSTDGGTTWSAPAAGASADVTAEGETLVQLRAVDAAGNTSAWSASGTVRIDRTAPTDPTVSGGSLRWQGLDQVTVDATGSTGGPSGLTGHEHRSSTDGGATWSVAAGGSSVTVTHIGETLLQFRGVDGAGNRGAWVPAHAGSPDAVGTVRLGELEMGPQQRISTTGPDGNAGWDAIWPDVAHNPDRNEYLAVWTADTGTAREDEVWARLADGSGSWTGSAFRVSDMGPDGSALYTAWEPRVTYNPDAREYVVVWSGDDNTAPLVDNENEIFAQRISAAGAEVGANDVRISDMGPDGNAAYDALNPRIAYNGAAHEYLVVWEGDDNTAPLVDNETEIFAQRLSPALAEVGANDVRISDMGADGNAAHDASRPDVAWNPVAGEYLAVWSGDDDTGPLVDNENEIFAQRLSGALAQTGANDARISDMGADGATTAAALTPAVAVNRADGGYLVAWSGDDASGGTVDDEFEIHAQILTPAGAETGVNDRRISGMGPDGSAVYRALTPDVAWSDAADQYLVTWTGNDDAAGLSDSETEVYAQRLLATGAEHGPDDLRVSVMGADGDPADTVGRPAVAAPDGRLAFLAVWDGSNSSPGGMAAGENEIFSRLIAVDVTAPTAPSVAGDSAAWQNLASITLTASGATDAESGVVRYEHRTSTDGGTTWTAIATGPAVTATAEGETLAEFRAVNGDGNGSAWVRATARIDRTAPAEPVAAGGSLAWRNAASVTVTASGSSGGPSGLAYEHRTSTDGGTTWTTGTAGGSVAVTAAGETLVRFRAVDGAGNASAWAPAAGTAGATVRLDRTAPTAPTVSGGSLAWQNVPSVTVTATGSTDTGGSGLSAYEHRTSADGGTTWTAGAAGGSVAVTTEGETLVQFRSTDGAGNAGAWTPAAPAAGATVRIDRGPPPQVTGVTAPADTNLPPAISWSPAADAVSYVVTRDGNEVGTVSSGTVFTDTGVPAEGTYVYRVIAVDGSGNRGAASAPVTVTYDTTPPAAPAAGGLSGGGGAWTNAASVTVTATPPGGTTLEHRTSTDGGTTWSAPAAGAAATVTAEGETLVQFRSVDAAGNAGAWVPATASPATTVRIDRTPPDAPTGLTGGGTVTDDPVVGWTAVPGAVAYTVLRDGAAIGTATGTSFTDTDVALPGTYVYRVVATDAAGNDSASSGPVTVTFTPADTIAPNTTIGGAPEGGTNVPLVTLTLTAGEPSTFQCRIDGGAWTACPATWVAGPLSEGVHTLEARATDTAGNTDPSPASVNVTVDTTAPPAPGITATADAGLPLGSRAGAVLLATTMSGDAVRVVVTEGARVVADGPAGPLTDAGLSDDTAYGYSAVAHDAAGNASAPATATATTPDRTPPAQPAPPTGSGYPIAVTWPSVPGAATYVLARDGSTAATGTGTSATDAAAVDAAAPPAPTGLAATVGTDGTVGLSWAPVTDRGTDYTMAVRAVDAIGNASVFSPGTTMTARSGVSAYRVIVDGTPVTDTPSTAFGVTGLSRSADHVITVVALDHAGNASPASTGVTVNIPAPSAGPVTLRITAGDRFVQPGKPVTFSAVLDGVSAPVTWTLDSGVSAGGMSVQHTYTEQGKRLVRATASVSGTTVATAIVEIVVDGTPPVVDLTAGAISVAVRASDPESDIDRMEWSDGGGAPQAVDPVAGIPLRPGANRITIRAWNRAGLMTEVVRDVARDTAKPVLRVRVPAMVVGRKATITLTGADAGSGFAHFEYGTRRFTAPTMKMVVPSGRRIFVGAVDRAGNRAVASFTVQRAKNVPRSTRIAWTPGQPRLKGRQAILLRSVQDQLKLLRKLPVRAKPVDRYTKRLAATVTKYQRKSKLRVTGAVDWPTRARLIRDLAKVTLTVNGG